MTNEEMERSIRDIWALFRETDRRLNRRFAETDRRQRKTSHQIENLARQVGGLGRKFGGFTEGVALPSIRRILAEHLHMDHISQRILVRLNDEEMEIDVLAYSRGEVNAVFVVEIKGRVTNNDIEDTIEKLKNFIKFFPEHKDKSLYGVIAAFDINDQIRQKVMDAGLYLAYIREDSFRLEMPEGFRPRRFDIQTI